MYMYQRKLAMSGTSNPLLSLIFIFAVQFSDTKWKWKELKPRFMEVKCHDNKRDIHSAFSITFIEFASFFLAFIQSCARLTATQRLKLLLSVMLWRFADICFWWYVDVYTDIRADIHVSVLSYRNEDSMNVWFAWHVRIVW